MITFVDTEACREPEELPVKRLVPPVKIMCECPKCGAHTEWDDYISYPLISTNIHRHVNTLDVTCGYCEHEYQEKYLFGVMVIPFNGGLA